MLLLTSTFYLQVVGCFCAVTVFKQLPGKFIAHPSQSHEISTGTSVVIDFPSFSVNKNDNYSITYSGHIHSAILWHIVSNNIIPEKRDHPRVFCNVNSAGVVELYFLMFSHDEAGVYTLERYVSDGSLPPVSEIIVTEAKSTTASSSAATKQASTETKNSDSALPTLMSLLTFVAVVVLIVMKCVKGFRRRTADTRRPTENSTVRLSGNSRGNPSCTIMNADDGTLASGNVGAKCSEAAELPDDDKEKCRPTASDARTVDGKHQMAESDAHKIRERQSGFSNGGEVDLYSKNGNQVEASARTKIAVQDTDRTPESHILDLKE